jgi:hypothetical protein
MTRLLRQIINWLFPFKEGEFPATPKGFNAAKKWAQSQPHTYSENLTLWEELYENHMDGYWVLAKINEQKRLADKYKEVKVRRKETKKYSVKKS